MALRGQKRHYRLNEIQPRNWQALAQRAGVKNLCSRMHLFVESADLALQRVEKILPADFPERVFAKISKGMRKQARQFLAAAVH
jgi:serine/threonine-protein kinase HipA